MAPKKKETVAEKPADAPAPAAAVAAPEAVEEVDRFAAVLEKLNEFAAGLKEVITHVKTLQKEHAKLQKASTKKVKKASGGSTGPRTLSGFAKPSALSDELCEFLGIAKGTQMARTEVTRSITEYIKKHSLQDASDKRHILPDAKLKKILNIADSDKLTYFNLQKFMKHHFTKTA